LLYKKQIETYHMKKISYAIEDGEVVTRYEGQTYIVKVAVGTDSMSNIPIYKFNLRIKY